ncbi:DNA methyltransferase [Mycolicibacterium fortuitum]|uniref:site-specific DNA-methyltransferase n=1 Tax=Mycolicibacterium fortuitum TaxID=1766 RepID=UPI0007ECFBD6|nr:DNA methyltransferase [Mycolicibacterium fortuitum]OBJ98401.1 DNA methyltransferase [Mycolicibacterium fortuitum]
MSRLNDLLRKLENSDAALAKDLRREVDALSGRRAFGLNFERHVPEAVELPGRPVRRGDKVRILPPRGSKATAGDDRLWRVVAITKPASDLRMASLELLGDEQETADAAIDDLVVVAEFRDPIYPGLVSTGKVERGADKPYHAVINAENYHALQTLLFTHRAKVDAIYIDPPYNTGAKDWKYNNDYVEGEDLYRHSKWLAFMERRLKLAKELLNPADSVLIVTIDEKEYLRLGLLLEQTFPEARIQMISSVINPKGVSRGAEFRRTDEYVFFVQLGTSAPARLLLGPEWSSSAAGAEGLSTEDPVEVPELQTPEWTSMMRRGSASARADRPSMFYPIYADPSIPKIVHVGEPLEEGVREAPVREGLVAILPLRRNGSEGRWQISAAELRARLDQGRVRLGRPTGYGYVVNYLPDGAYAAVLSDQFEITGRAEDGSIVAIGNRDQRRVAPTQWKLRAHNASEYGSTLLASFLPGRSFPFPKSLFAVEDTLRFFVANKPNALVVDFFAGSGTTTHATMRLNKQDSGRRRSISITNNEVAAEDQAALRAQGLRPGDPDWEQWGICDYITKPRVRAATTGATPEGEPINGDYRFTDEFPMSDGFEENIEFFTLTYEAPLRVSSNREFSKIAPLLWLRAGSEGRRIEQISAGWEVADTYGVLADLNLSETFIEAVAAKDGIRIAFIVTDEDRLFESVVRELPDHVEPVRMYEAYLQNFEIETGRSAL